ncbi:MAG: YfhO family protein [Bacteroidota bacterium]
MSKRPKKKVVKKTTKKTTKPAAKKATPKSENTAPFSFDKMIAGKGVYIAAALLTVVGFVVFRKYLLLQQVYIFKDIGSDTLNLFYPQFVHIADYIREYGFPTTWSFRQGMGQNILPNNAGDPFNWLMYLKGGHALAYLIAYAEYLKVIAGGLFFFGFLRVLNLNMYTSIVGAILYGFTGFMIVGGGWYIFSSEAVFAALLFLAFEMYFSRGKWQLLPIAVCLVGSYMAYNFIPYAMLIFFYSLFRFIGERGWNLQQYVKFMAGTLLYALIGFGLSALFSISGLVAMANSPRVAGDVSFFADLMGKFNFESSLHYATAIMRTFSNDLMGTGSEYVGYRNYLEAPMFYCGLSSLLLAPQVFGFLDRKRRILFAIAAFMFIAPVILPFLRYAFWLFAGDYYRGFSLVVAGGLLYFGLHALHHILETGKINLVNLGVTLLILLALLFVPLAENVTVDGTIRNSVALFLVLEAGLIFLLTVPNFKALAQIGFLSLVCLEAAYMSSFPVNNRQVVTAQELESKVGYNDFTIDAVDYIKSIDQGFYRMEKDYSSGTAVHTSINDGRIQGYFGTSSYHSFNNNHYIKFLTDVEIIDPTDENETRWALGLKSRPLLLNWASNKYWLLKTDQFQLPGYSKIHQVGDVNIFQNSYFVNLGFTYDKYMPENEFTALDGFLKKDITLFRSVVLSEDQIQRFGSNLSRIDAATYPENYTPDIMVNDINGLRANFLNITDFKEYRIAGNITVDQPKMLFLSMAHDSGWKAKVNGKSTPIERVNIGFMGIMLDAGTSEIVLSYQPPFYLISLLLTIGCFLLYVFLLWRYRKQPEA